MTAARYHCDKHVVKMILETAQLLSTAHRVLDGDYCDDRVYRPTHMNHPCGVWVRESVTNYLWTYELFSALCDEYHHRYNKEHLCETKLHGVLAKPPKFQPAMGWTRPAMAMPVEYHDDCVITAYRAYYVGEKAYMAKWSGRDIPWWFTYEFVDDM